MDKIKIILTYFLIVCITMGTLNIQAFNVAFAEAGLDCVEEAVLSKDGTSCLDQPVVEPPTENPPVVEPPTEDQPIVKPPTENPPVVEPPTEDQPIVEPPTEDQPVVQPPTEDQPIVKPPTEDQPIVEPPTEDQPVVEPPTENPPVVEPILQDIQLPEGFTIGSQQDNRIDVVIEATSTGAPSNNGVPRVAVPEGLLNQLAAFLKVTEGRQTIGFSLEGETGGSFFVPSNALASLAQSNSRLFIDFRTGVGSSGYFLANMNHQQLAGSRGVELAVATAPIQQFRQIVGRATRFEQYLIMADGSRVPIDPITMNFYTQNRLNIDGLVGNRTIRRYDELLRTWLPVPTWEQNRGNELQFTGTYSGVYAAMPAQQPRIIDNPNRITASTRALINSGIIRGNPQGSLDLDGDFTLNQGLTMLMRSLGLEAGVLVDSNSGGNTNNIVAPTQNIVLNTTVAGGALELARQIGLLNGVSMQSSPNNPIPIGDTIRMMNNGLRFSANQLGANLQNNNNSPANEPTNADNSLLTGESNQSPANNSAIPVQEPQRSGISGVLQSMDLETALMAVQTMDLETALMAVQTKRASLLESQLKDQIDSVQQKNKQIADLNSLLNNARTLDSKLNLNKMTDADYKQLEQLLQQQNITLQGTGTDAYIEALQKLISDNKSQIDGLSNSQQMDMLRLQSLPNKRNEAFDVMTNFIKKMQENRNSIIGNMR